MWVPGCWYWNDEQYVLRHGYWLHQQPGWVWVPSHYCWTPRGYAFAAGHWDYTLEQRGVLFAPVCFSAGTTVAPDYVYSPEVCVDVGLLTDCLFADPCYSHYFFGDYYDSFYFGCGIYPWFASVNFHTWCCPTYAYCRWQGCLRDRDWEKHEHHTFDERCVDRSLRPSRTLLEQNQRVAALAPADRGNWQLGKPLYNVAAAGAGKFSRIDLSARNEIARQANEVHAFRAARTRWEQPSAASEAGGRAGATTVPAAHGAAAPAAHVAEGRGPADWTPQHAAPTASPATAPVERRASATWFTPRSAPVTPFAPAPQAYHEFRPTYEPPREVHVSQPERVSLPSASYWGRSSGSVSIERTPPSHPAYEHASGSANQRRDR